MPDPSESFRSLEKYGKADETQGLYRDDNHQLSCRSSSRDIIVAAHQQITHEWWSKRKEGFDLFASQLVWDEAEAGDRGVSQRRLAVLQAIQLLEITVEGLSLANELVVKGPLPRNAAEDAIHIATAVINGMDYLLHLELYSLGKCRDAE